MIKVSFKKDSTKIQTFNDRCVVVTMVGQMIMPSYLWQIFPNDMANWMWEHPSVDASWGNCTKHNDVIRLEFSGKAKCADDDVFNAETGRRIAESRAKIRLYKFIHTLLCKLYEYYFGITFGDRYALCNIDKTADYNKPGGVCEEMGKYQGLLIKESHHLGELLRES